MVEPYLSYGILAYLNCGVSYSNRITRIQKKCIRCINKLGSTDHTNDYFVSNRILKLEDLQLYQVAIYIYKTLYFNHDPSLLNFLSFQINMHDHSTRSRHQLSVPLFHLSTSQNSIEYKGVKFWNSLPCSKY